MCALIMTATFSGPPTATRLVPYTVALLHIEISWVVLCLGKFHEVLRLLEYFPHKD